MMAKEKVAKERPPHKLKQNTPKSPAHLPLLGKPEGDFKIKIKSRIGSKIVGPNSFGQ